MEFVCRMYEILLMNLKGKQYNNLYDGTSLSVDISFYRSPQATSHLQKTPYAMSRKNIFVCFTCNSYKNACHHVTISKKRISRRIWYFRRKFSVLFLSSFFIECWFLCGLVINKQHCAYLPLVYVYTFAIEIRLKLKSVKRREVRNKLR